MNSSDFFPYNLLLSDMILFLSMSSLIVLAIAVAATRRKKEDA